MKLYPHQLTGVQWLLAHPRGGLFDDQGLGKTAQVIVAADRLNVDNGRVAHVVAPQWVSPPRARMLVLSPSAVAHNWQRETARWSPNRRAQVITSSSQIVQRDADTVVVTHSLLLKKAIVDQLRGFDVTVLDEAHFFRTPSAKRTRAFFLGADAIARRSRYCWCLTGTPMPNNPSELWAMLAGIAPDRLREPNGNLLSFSRFRDRYCVTVDTHYGLKIVGAKNVPELKQRLDGFALRRLKTEALNLPPVRWGVVALDGEALPTEPNAPRDLEDDTYLAAVQRDASFAQWRHASGLAKCDAAIELLKSDLESGMRKVVVFAHHLDVINRLHAGLREFNPVQLTGATPPTVRQAAVDNFQNDPQVRVFIAQLTAGGVGITLTAASDVVFVEQSFVPGDNAQAADRVHRIGQTMPVLVRFLSLAGSVDEVLVEILARKTEMISAVLK